MNAKLHIDILQGVLDVEGDEAFVKSIYDDFKGRLAEQVMIRPLPLIEASKSAQALTAPETSASRKRKAPRRASGSDSGKSKFADYAPRFDPNIDLAKLEAFYANFEPKNHREKILLFAIFMRDELKKAPCSADHIFSCYHNLRGQTEIPEAFVQALRDAYNKGGFVELDSPHEIRITIAGENYFYQKMQRREPTK